mgnify:FL=1
MQRTSTESDLSGPDIFQLVRFRFLPYWPLFILLSGLCLTGAWLYLRHALPVYNVSATLLIKDERKGAEENKMLDALNVYNSSKIVENEIEVIHSNALMRSVVEQLGLYAGVFEQRPVFDAPLYTKSPVKVSAKEPGKLQVSEKIPLTMDPAARRIGLNGVPYPAGEWVNTAYGQLRFDFRPGVPVYKRSVYYLTMLPVKEAAARLSKLLEVASANKLSTVVNLSLKDQDQIGRAHV